MKRARSIRGRDSKFKPVKRCSRCNKLSYHSQNAANRAIRERGGRRAYQCPHDRKFWHVTSRPERY